MLIGKGMFIWKVISCEGGDLSRIVAEAEKAQLDHLIIKGADGPFAFNVSVDLPKLCRLLRDVGIDPWMYQYIYGNNPIGEARYAITRMEELGAEGLIVDAEKEMKQPGYGARAESYSTYLREHSDFLIGLSSYRYPSVHQEFPWSSFQKYIHFNMPQVYWEQAHNSAYQLQKSFDEYRVMSPQLPFIPTGSAYKRSWLWEATVSDIEAFMLKATSMSLPAFNFWEWSNCRKYIPDVWEAISNFGAPFPHFTLEERVNRLEDLLDQHLREGPHPT